MSHVHEFAKGPDGWTCIHCPLRYAPEALARRSDPDTSHDAAESVTRLTQTRRDILEILKERGPMTDETIWRWLVSTGRDGTTSVSGARTRRKELVDIGLVEDSGARALGSTNRKMIVWRAA